MKRLLMLIIVAAFVASMASSAVAVVDWQFVGKSGFKQSNPATMNDWRRIRVSGAVADDAGNIFAICNDAENGTYTYPEPATGAGYKPINPPYNDAQGGVTIFRADGTRQDIKLTDFVDSVWSTSLKWGPNFNPATFGYRTDNKLVGAVTKLVKAGDGNIYGLLNWLEIHWDNPRQNQRIVRINADGTVESVWSPPTPYASGVGGGAFDIRSASGSYYWVEDSDPKNKIRGIAVGGDGNVYWTMNGATNYWKYHTLWRYDVSTGVAAEAPVNAPATGFDGNQGWSETHRMQDLEYVGNGYFAIIKSGGSEWRADSIRWEKGTPVTDTHGWNNIDYPGTRHMGAPVPIGSSNRPASANSWGRDHITAIAYDPARNILWAAGRGAGSGPYSYDNDGGGTSIVDLSGNPALRMTKAAAKKNSYNRSDVVDADRVLTLAARFKVESSSVDWDAPILCVMPKSGPLGKSPAGILKVRGGRFVLVDVENAQTADLGPMNNDWNEVYCVADANAGVLECWFNGSPATVTEPVGGWRGMNARVRFGAGIYDNFAFGSINGSASVLFDWVGFAKQRVVPGGVWPSTPLLSLWDDPATYPDQFGGSNVMSRWNGIEGGSGLFTQLVWSGEDTINQTTSWTTEGIQSSESWHTNGNDPYASGVGNRGHYWVNTIAINPDDGTCWQGWSAETNYSHPDRGSVMIRGRNIWEFFDAGVPEPGADVVALTFRKPDADNTEVYALTCNRTTGEYSLYKATASTDSPFNYYQYMPLDLVKLHRRGIMFSLDSAKVVTYSNPDQGFFYIESVNANGVPESGIKVIKGNDGVPVPYVGDLVDINGYLDVVDGEAVIRAFGVNSTGTGTLPPPLTMQCKAVGGAVAGAQPALEPINGPSNVGLLVSVVGAITAIDPVNEFDPQWFTVDDGTGSLSYYVDAMGTLVAVPGVMVKGSAMSLTLGQTVSAIGVSSVDSMYYYPDPVTPVFKGRQRCVLTRGYEDVVVY